MEAMVRRCQNLKVFNVHFSTAMWGFRAEFLNDKTFRCEECLVLSEMVRDDFDYWKDYSDKTWEMRDSLWDLEDWEKIHLMYENEKGTDSLPVLEGRPDDIDMELDEACGIARSVEYQRLKDILRPEELESDRDERYNQLFTMSLALDRFF